MIAIETGDDVSVIDTSTTEGIDTLIDLTGTADNAATLLDVLNTSGAAFDGEVMFVNLNYTRSTE